MANKHKGSADGLPNEPEDSWGNESPPDREEERTVVLPEAKDEGAEAPEGEAEAGPVEVFPKRTELTQTAVGVPPYEAIDSGVFDRDGYRVVIAGFDHNRKVSGPIWAALVAHLLNKHFKH